MLGGAIGAVADGDNHEAERAGGGGWPRGLGAGAARGLGPRARAVGLPWGTGNMNTNSGTSEVNNAINDGKAII